MRKSGHKRQTQAAAITRGLAIVTALIVAVALLRIIAGAGSRDTNTIAAQAAAPSSRIDSRAAPAGKDPQSILDEKSPLVVSPSLASPAQRSALGPIPGATEPATFQAIAGAVPLRAGYGAIVQVQPPFPSLQYHIENSWYLDSDAGTQRLMVFAGNLAGPGGQNTDRGVLVVVTSRITTVEGQATINTLETSPYLTPDLPGSLHITAAEPGRLVLQSAQGATLAFDLVARSFSPAR